MTEEIVIFRGQTPQLGDIFFVKRGSYKGSDPYIITRIRNDLPFVAEGEKIYPFAQVDQRYEIPLESPWGKIQRVGNSGLARRRVYRLPVASKPQKIWIYDADKKVVNPEIREVPDIKELREKQKFLERLRRESLQRAAEKQLAALFEEEDVVEIKCFNDTPMAEYLPSNYIILREYITTRGNTTVILGKKKPILRVPDKLKGLVIGRHGQNIKNVRAKYKMKIKIV